jgi:hypothetical protein
MPGQAHSSRRLWAMVWAHLLGIWYGQPSKTQADGNDQDQGFK